MRILEALRGEVERDDTIGKDDSAKLNKRQWNMQLSSHHFCSWTFMDLVPADTFGSWAQGRQGKARQVGERDAMQAQVSYSRAGESTRADRIKGYYSKTITATRLRFAAELGLSVASWRG